NAICEGEDLTLTARGGDSYEWSGPNGFTSTDQNPVISDITLLAAGDYTVTVTDNNGCSSTASVTVVVLPAPIATAEADPNPVCEGEDLQLSSSGGTTYSWSGPNGFTSTDQNPVISDITLLAAGEYTVTVTDNNGCSSTTSVTVLVNTLPIATASATPNPICEGEDLQLSSSGGTTYSWNGPNGFTSTDQNPVINDIT